MTDRIDLYDTSYDKFSAGAQEAVRRATYGEDLGQTGWMTAGELRRFMALLELDRSSSVLEIGSGSGGAALLMAQEAGCSVVGLDVNRFGVDTANALARRRGLDALAGFRLADASRPLDFGPGTFDAVFSNDAVCHLPGRPQVLAEWRRVLKPGGLMLFTDALVVTGCVSHEEIAARSAIGYYCFVPAGLNERLIAAAGFELLRSDDLTAGAAEVSKRWHDAREAHRAAMAASEGEARFEGLQAFLRCVHALSGEERLSRRMYLARRPAG